MIVNIDLMDSKEWARIKAWEGVQSSFLLQIVTLQHLCYWIDNMMGQLIKNILTADGSVVGHG